MPIKVYQHAKNNALAITSIRDYALKTKRANPEAFIMLDYEISAPSENGYGHEYIKTGHFYLLGKN